MCPFLLSKSYRGVGALFEDLGYPRYRDTQTGEKQTGAQRHTDTQGHVMAMEMTPPDPSGQLSFPPIPEHIFQREL